MAPPHLAGAADSPVGQVLLDETFKQAAIGSRPGPWLYFVAVNPTTGETRFAVDAAGHAANVKLFQAWCTKNPGKC